MDSLFIAAGLVFLLLGGEALVRGASILASRLGMSQLLIGLTVVGFGTSTPELLVSVQSALAGAPDIAVGNVVGSNIANILLIGGTAALLSPFFGRGYFPARDLLIMAAMGPLLLALAQFGTLSRLIGLGLCALLVAYLVYTYIASRGEDQGEQPVQPTGWKAVLSLALALVFVGVGILALVLGADLLVHGATALARDWGVSEAVIGLTIVAVGTSLPELATTLVAAWRGKSAIAIGNIIGSNIFNVLGILGITAVVLPVPVNPLMALFDIPVMLATGVVFAALLLFAPRLGRWTGAASILAYAAYVASLVLRGG